MHNRGERQSSQPCSFGTDRTPSTAFYSWHHILQSMKRCTVWTVYIDNCSFYCPFATQVLFSWKRLTDLFSWFTHRKLRTHIQLTSYSEPNGVILNRKAFCCAPYYPQGRKSAMSLHFVHRSPGQGRRSELSLTETRDLESDTGVKLSPGEKLRYAVLYR